MKKKLACVAIVLATLNINAQTEETVEPELKHYMPLYLDLPAELNVKKGYKEADVAFGYADFKDFTGQKALVEFDFAPINKLGFEIEVPFTFVQEKNPSPVALASHGEENSAIAVHEEGGGPVSAMALRIGFNYSLFSSQKAKTTISAGYYNEFESAPFKHFGKPLLEGNVYNPFIAIAKIWGKRLHSMVYTGTATQQNFQYNVTKTAVRLNTILTYRFGKSEKESFIGIECNQTFAKDVTNQTILRPQAQLQLSEKFLLGIVLGLPVVADTKLNASGFLRLVYSIK